LGNNFKNTNMKNIKIDYLKKSVLLVLISFVTISCTRDLADNATLSTNSKTAEIFTDTPIGMGTNFYFPYGGDANNPVGSKFTAWTVDQTESYKGTASMRFDVPNATDPQGNYAGGIFKIDGAGRDLSGYDALTFWAKASQGVVIGEIGFGEDFYPNKYITTMTNVSLGTNWAKYIIPIPNASKLVNEKGMLRYAAGTQGTNGLGYVFWIDELKFEKLGTMKLLQPSIFNGNNVTAPTIIGAEIPITDIKVSYNMASGANQSVSVSQGYFDFTTSVKDVVKVNDLGILTVTNAGTCLIKASLAGVEALGSKTINSIGSLPNAPIPSQLQSNVKSIFSDSYTLETSSNFKPGFGGSTTQTQLITKDENSVYLYSNNNYSGIMFKNIVNASTLSFMHVDVFALQSGIQVQFQIRDVGTNGVINTNITNGQPELDDKDLRFTTPNLTVNGWNSFNIPLNGNIANQKNNLKAIILAGGTNFILDNIYFY
jgi:hypothetical protein